MTKPTNSHEAGAWFDGAEMLLVFDGWCGVCTRSARWLMRHDVAGRVRALPNQTPGLVTALGLTRADVDRAAWVIDRTGRRYAGAAAINQVLRVASGGWKFAAMLYRLPLLGWCEDIGYALFARNRGRFGRWGIAPACSVESAECEPEGSG